MNDDRLRSRLGHIQNAIAHIRALLAGKSIDHLRTEPATLAALERFLEIVREAARHIPDRWKAEHGPNILWRRVADLGNHIRHAYDSVDLEALWVIYVRDLDELAAAIDSMLGADLR